MKTILIIGSVFIPLCVIAILYFEPLGISAMLEPNEKIIIILTIVASEFAGYEGISTYLDYKLTKERHLIEDLRNELEKAYSMIYQAFNEPTFFTEVLDKLGVMSEKLKAEKKLWITPQQKSLIDEAFTKFPYMFSTRIRDMWKRDIQSAEIQRMTSSPPSQSIEFYLIPTNFKEYILAEYEKKVNDYNRLVGKKQKFSTGFQRISYN